jgi:ribosomal protein L24
MLYAATEGQRVLVLMGQHRDKEGVIVESQPYRNNQEKRYSVRVEVDGVFGRPEYDSEHLAPVQLVSKIADRGDAHKRDGGFDDQ